MASLQPSSPIVAGAAEAPFHTQMNNVEQQLEKHPTNRTILWEELPKSTTVICPTDNTILWVELPKVTPEVTRNTSEEEIKMIKEMVSMVPSLPGRAMTTSVSSTILDTDDEIKTETEAGKANLLQICPTVSGIFEFTATAKQTDECLLICDSTWDKPSKNNEIITNEVAVDLKGHADTVDKNSPYTSAQFMPYYAKPDIEYKQSTLLETYPTVTKIVGMPSKLTVKDTHWLIDEKPLWKKQSKTKDILQPYASKEDEKNKKEMVRLVPSCPREARNLGFPSAQQYSLVFCGPNMVDICPGCPSVSSTPGLPSISEDSNRAWISQEEPLLEKQIKTELLMNVSPTVMGEIKLMGALLPSCPKHSCIPGIPSILQPTTAQYGSDMKSLLASCSKTSCSECIPSLIEHFSRKWATDCKPLGLTLPNVDTVIIEDRPCNNDMKDIASLASTCPKETCIPGLSSAMGPIVSYNGFSSVNLLPSCPATSSMAGFPSMQKTDIKDWNTIHELLWEKQIKTDSLLLLENNKMDKDMEGVISLASSCPRESVISGFPSVPKPSMNTNMVSLSISCSKVSRIPGFPSSHNSEELTMSKEPLFEPRMKEKQVSLIDRCERDERAMKAMLSLVPSCPKVARASGFPSYLNPLTVYCVPNITSLLTLCSQVSKVPGFPSVDGDVRVEWVTEKGSLMKRLPKKWVILDTKNGNKKIMKNMVSCVPSCPKKSSIPGFPSIPNPKIVYYGLNVVNLLPLCPLVSVIPGFSSLERHNKEGWVTELGSLTLRPQKNIQIRINSSPINLYKPNNMHALVPSCPQASKIPGFTSIPRYNMLSLVPVNPKVSSLPGFASFEKASKFQWHFNPHTLCDKPSKETFVVIHSPNQDGETVKTMLDLAPSCPEASRIPGFPSAPKTKSKIEPSMIRLVHCCSSSSSIKGFGSMTTTPSTGWPNKAKPILIKPREKRAEIIMPFAGQDQLYCYKTKSMVTLVTSCPKEARVCGFPSAQVVNRPPNMVSLYTSAPCVSCVPGFPSARMLSAECINMQTRTTHSKSLFQKLQNEKIFFIAKFQANHKHSEEEIKNMVAMAPSCPHLTRIPGFPSISQLNPTEKETITFPFPCSTEKYTSQELPHAQSTQSYLKDARIPGVPSTSLIRPSTALVYGETFTVLRLRPRALFYVLFLFLYFTMFAFMTEDKFKGGAKQNIDRCVDKG